MSSSAPHKYTDWLDWSTQIFDQNDEGYTKHQPPIAGQKYKKYLHFWNGNFHFYLEPLDWPVPRVMFPWLIMMISTRPNETGGNNAMSTAHYADSLTNYILNCVNSSPPHWIIAEESFCWNISWLDLVRNAKHPPRLLSLLSGKIVWSIRVSLFVCYI